MRTLRYITLVAALLAAAAFTVRPAQAQFSGCGAGVFGSGSIGMLSGSGPVGLESTGWAPGVTGECGWKFGSLYLGGGADLSWQYGDLNTLGLRNDFTVFAKGGVVVSNATMLYLHGGRAWLTTTGPDVHAWKVGLGSETKLGATPTYLDLRYTYTTVDEKDLGLPPSANVNGHSFRVGLNVKLGPGMFGGKGPVFSNEDYSSKGCDPKIDIGCKVR